MRRPAPRSRGQRGATLVEVLVASLLGIIAVGTINWFSRFQLFSLRNQAAQSDLQMVARGVSDVFARDVRRAGFDPHCTAAVAAITHADPYTLTLQSDLDGNGTLGGIDETLTYRLNFTDGNSRLERVANDRTDVLLDGIEVGETRFRYFAGDGLEVVNVAAGLTSAEMATIRRVRLELAAEVHAADPGRALPGQVRLGNDVDIRNRHFVNSVGCP